VSRRAESEAGVALVAAVVALGTMSLLAVGLAYTSVVDQRLTQNALAALQAEALARSGVTAAVVLLDERGDAGEPDTLRSSWARDVGPQPLGAGRVEVHVEDEARRLDVNEPQLRPAVGRLLAAAGLDPRLATAPDAPHGLLGVGELVRGGDVATVARLRRHLTAAGERLVNPNTASREVLLALLQDATVVDRLLAERARAPIAIGGLPAEIRSLLADRGQYYTVRVLATVGEVRRAVEATVSAPGDAAGEVVAWRPLVPDG
jgi:type II secretory pathway component PulK